MTRRSETFLMPEQPSAVADAHPTLSKPQFEEPSFLTLAMRSPREHLNLLALVQCPSLNPSWQRRWENLCEHEMKMGSAPQALELWISNNNNNSNNKKRLYSQEVEAQRVLRRPKPTKYICIYT